jgi:hypothetical protein
MLKTLALAMSLAAAFAVAQNTQPLPVKMQDLTVPQDRLPIGCGLSAADSVPLDGNRIRGGLWGGLPIATNPWTGTDRLLVALIRERVESPRAMPDAPMLTRSELARFRLALADGVEEGYAAFYVQGEAEVIGVYGLRFADAERTRLYSTSRVSPATPVEIGSIRAFVSGNDGPCFQAIAAYVRSLEQ